MASPWRASAGSFQNGTLTFQPISRMPRRVDTPPLHIAIDTGGTFTDCVWIDRGQVRTLKVFSTPDDPSRAIADAVAQICESRSITLLHGTTVGTNTLLQRSGARVALVTTAGFEDVIEIGRQARPKLYDLFFDRIEPLVPSKLRFGVEERSACDGKILQKTSAAKLRKLAASIRKQEPDAIAISLLFSFANPKNESAVAAALKSLSLPLSVSHRILPEFREYERTSTVVVNAYLQPIMQKYLSNLQRRIDKQFARSRIFVMQSSGGIASLAAAVAEPVRTVLSGPAGGVVGAAAMAQRSGYDQVISFDMGGTSTDVALIDREPRAGNQSEVAGFPVGVPMLDIHTVGAGGGSIARFDAGGALRVGPESAGAHPGPICYGRGLQPTVTDANLILGRLRSEHFLGGNFQLDEARTRRVISQWLKKQHVTQSLEAFAGGVIRVVNATMEKAIRVVSVERGYDSRQFTLVAFGGAGGLHACELAQALRIPRVMVPALPGALSAYGILVSDVVKDYSKTVLLRARTTLPIQALDSEFAVLRRQAERDFHADGWRGKVHQTLSIDVRYSGQGYEINVPYDRRVIDSFRHEHRRRYGYDYPDREVELVTVRVRASIPSPIGTKNLANRDQGKRDAKRPQQAKVVFSGQRTLTTIWQRNQLPPGRKFSGPAIVVEYSATTVVPPRAAFRIDASGNLIVGIRP